MSAQFSDEGRAKLRTLVAVVEQEMVRLPEAADKADAALRGAVAELFKALDLGPAPQLRACPGCGGTCMRGASRCSTCWIVLTPLPALSAAEVVAAVVVAQGGDA